MSNGLHLVEGCKANGAPAWARTGPHPEEEQLEGYAMRTISEVDCEEIEQHLQDCEPCRNRLGEAGQWATLMKSGVFPESYGTVPKDRRNLRVVG
jgi:predicted anti-sigma-YlaC factor YlaD